MVCLLFFNFWNWDNIYIKAPFTLRNICYSWDRIQTENNAQNLKLAIMIVLKFSNGFINHPYVMKSSCIFSFAVPIATPTNIWGEKYNSTAIMVYWDPVVNTRQYMKGKLWGYQVYWTITFYSFTIFSL